MVRRRLENPIFIVGVGRSGTSLLQSMLGAHRKIAMLPETGFLRRYVATRRIEKLVARGGIDAVVNELKGDSRFGRMNVDPRALVEECQSDGLPITGTSLYEVVGRHFLGSEDARLGDKDPPTIEYLPILAAHWPQAYVVHVIRDPRDVVRSRKAVAWARGRSTFLHVFTYLTQFGMGRRYGRLFGIRYIEVRYEDVLHDASATLQRLCTSLDLPFDREMLSFGDAAKQLVATDELEWKRETLGPLLHNNVGRWKDTLRPWHVALTERACREGFNVGRYETVMMGEMGWFQMLGQESAVGIMHLMDWLYRSRRWWQLARAGARFE